ncbi:MAG: IMP cyclohydrolase [Deltaproteobacteria bacterium]|jgi:phosphoribosylaminoimidazolecarboxamide formyltransferase/IMP cyclohydrolase|nr:IMP cyclohydrolase [Deltaproteobacteria bacterium]
MAESQYRKVLTDNFPTEITITVGDQSLTYRKELYAIPDEGGNPRTEGLRYGENPGQEAALYRLVRGNLSIAGVEYIGPGKALVSGLGDMDPNSSIMYGARKHPSKTNLTDVDSALNVLRYLSDTPAAVIVKHNTPCGAALGPTLYDAFSKAFEADIVAAFGGAAVVNRPLDKETAGLMASRYMEVVAAPEYEDGAVAILSKKPDLRIFKIKNIGRIREYAHERFLDIKSLMDGGIVIQQSPLNAILKTSDFLPATCEFKGETYSAKRAPTQAELEDLLFGWAVEQAVVSNSVLFVKDKVTVSIAGGQQDRVGVVEIAAHKARRNLKERLCYKKHGLSFQDLEKKLAENPGLKDDLKLFEHDSESAKGGIPGSSLVSDAFFPFRDALDVAIKDGISAVVHPGGALRDWESIVAANEANPPVAMVFTNQRAFKH